MSVGPFGAPRDWFTLCYVHAVCVENFEFTQINDSVFNAIFTRKSLINGWIKTLRKINYPVVGITTPGPHQIDFLRENKKIINELEIIIDIEFNSTTIFISNKDYELSSQKIPYGSTLYRKKELVESYFSRLIKSIKLITMQIVSILI